VAKWLTGSGCHLGREWVSRGMGVLDGGSRAPTVVSGDFCPIGLNGMFFARDVFYSCVKSS